MGDSVRLCSDRRLIKYAEPGGEWSVSVGGGGVCGGSMAGNSRILPTAEGRLLSRCVSTRRDPSRVGPRRVRVSNETLSLTSLCTGSPVDFGRVRR